MKGVLIVILFPLFFWAQSPSKKIKVLFLGNSYTYVNNLPQLIADLALANGDTLLFDGNLLGGYTFQNHCSDANSLSKIALGKLGLCDFAKPKVKNLLFRPHR